MRANTEPLVSLVTPSFNQGAFLEATLESVLGQTWPAIEHVVMDGGSTDGSAAILERYRSRLHEVLQEFGQYTETDGAADFARYLHGQSTDNLLELRYTDRRRVHNLKYYTWVEQQGKTYEEIQQQWYEPNYWTDVQKQADEIDELIVEFNKEVGLV